MARTIKLKKEIQVGSRIQNLEQWTTVMCTFFLEGQRVDRSCSFMDSHGFCLYVHTDNFRRFAKEEARADEGAEAKVKKKPAGTHGKNKPNG